MPFSCRMILNEYAAWLGCSNLVRGYDGKTFCTCAYGNVSCFTQTGALVVRVLAAFVTRPRLGPKLVQHRIEPIITKKLC